MIQHDPRAGLQKLLSTQRRELASKSPRDFARVYLGHHFKLPTSRLHEMLFDMLEQATETRAARIAIAAPRGHAKTTVTGLCYSLWSILYDREPFILIVSATKELASTILRSIKDEIQSNPLLLEDFPDRCRPPGTRGGPKPWRDNQITLPGGGTILAAGAGQSIRGLKRRDARPTLIIVDDLEEQEQTLSADQREKLRAWFTRTLLPAGEPRTNIIVVGTILHYDSLLANLTSKQPGNHLAASWDSVVFQAVEAFSEKLDIWDRWERIYLRDEIFDKRTGPQAAQDFLDEYEGSHLEGTRVLWPERESYTDLMIQRLTLGRASFQAEKQNEPLDPETCVFREDSFRYWDAADDPEFRDVDELIAGLGYHLRIYGACDPSLGRSGSTGDFTAIVTVAKHRETGVLYVIDADITRRQPDATLNHIAALSKLYDYDEFRVESDQFQSVLADQLEDRIRTRGRYMRIDRLTNTGNKRARIEGLEALVASGRLRFSRRHTMLLDQLRTFPLGAHDAGPDALEMAVSLALDPGGEWEVIQMP